MRIRTIKPEFFTHEGIYEAEIATGLPLRLAFIGLWCAADREGRFKWEPRRLGVSILPYDSIDFSRVLDALSTRGFVVNYRVGDAIFGCIPSFTRHQVINNRESDSSIPEPSMGESIISQCERVPHACLTRASREKAEGKGREGERKEGIVAVPAHASANASIEAKTPTAKGKPESQDEVEAFFIANGSNAESAATFFDHFTANGWKQGGKTAMKDWQAAARNWIRKDKRDQNGYGNGHCLPLDEISERLPIAGLDIGADEATIAEAAAWRKAKGIK
jgi:hypothetical protein